MVAASNAGEAACETQCVARCTPVRNAVGATVGVAAKTVHTAAKVAVAPLKLLHCLCDKVTACQPVCEPVAVESQACEPVVKPACEPVCKERCKPIRKALKALKPKCQAAKCVCVPAAVESKPCGC